VSDAILASTGVEAPAVLFIAEAGVNHNGQLDLALKLCDVAHSAGADVVKFQTFCADDLVTASTPTAAYQRRATGDASQYEMLKRLELDDEAHRVLFEHCRRIGIEFCSTPFSVNAVAQLRQLGVRRLKLPSGELNHKALLEAAADTGLPLIVSTGMATLDEVSSALAWIRARPRHSGSVTLLHCTSAYPAADADLNLKAIAHLQREFGPLGVGVGYSDHSLGLEACLVAVALGAVVVEKHFTLARDMPGPDHAASLLPDELAALVRGVRRVSSMLGDGVKQPSDSEREVAQVARRSVTAMVDLVPGQTLTAECLACRRPATGIEPAGLELLIGRRVRRAVAAGQALQWADVEMGASGSDR
jgi:N-acetylneuraminate synthase/N,N'-diacetyllegionaminate synthase